MSTLTKEWLEQNLETKLREQLAKNPQLRTPNDAKILCEGGLSQGHIKYFTVHMQDISVMAERKKFISGGMPAAAYHAEITMDGNCYKFPETGYWDIFDGRPKMVYKIMQTIDNEYVEKLCPLDYNSARVHDYILYPDANNPFQICDST
ncbi:MAG: hypothetical protein FWC51_03625, partial [Proteobacteria bacterium]|nr:hypothetical protein [Pseudomonadota bacterium]